MYTDTVVIAGLLVVFGAIAVGVGFFIFIWLDDTDNPADEEHREDGR